LALVLVNQVSVEQELSIGTQLQRLQLFLQLVAMDIFAIQQLELSQLTYQQVSLER